MSSTAVQTAGIASRFRQVQVVRLPVIAHTLGEWTARSAAHRSMAMGNMLVSEEGGRRGMGDRA